MSRAERLLNLVQLLRQHRRPVSAQLLAQELKVARRTLYRDIATLRAQGASIDGEPGVGYLLKPGFMLPPLMFSEDEIEAIVFGVRLAASRADRELGASAERALAKIASVLPADLRESVYDVSLLVVPATNGPQEDPAILTMIREAIRGELKLSISYRDGEDRLSERVIWPFAVGGP
ncbi:YafY family transcriptional regulator [Agrobacterium sp. MOPV5]|uniref:helix-turn-helix transcriptional regulator n=1 Tax=Agrobacterium leguminum TaxID=2792015 RepID=UPI0018C304F9|nr:YafY family protein [Agrobacterium leguminum]MBG0511636.1 YafY family transcriptional regulator [Agrobacterium leguminum]